VAKFYKDVDVIRLIPDVAEIAAENNDIVIVDTPSGYESKEDYAAEALADLPTIEVSEDKEVELGKMLNGAFKLGFENGKQSVEVSEDAISRRECQRKPSYGGNV